MFSNNLENKIYDYNKINNMEVKHEEKNDTQEKVDIENGIHVLAPKPMPRTSRTGSVCEPIEDISNVPKPVARPRTNSCTPVVTSVNPNLPIAGGYKVLI